MRFVFLVLAGLLLFSAVKQHTPPESLPGQLFAQVDAAARMALPEAPVKRDAGHARPQLPDAVTAPIERRPVRIIGAALRTDIPARPRMLIPVMLARHSFDCRVDRDVLAPGALDDIAREARSAYRF